MSDILIKNARIVDGTAEQPADATNIRLADGEVKEHGNALKTGDTTIVIDAAEQFVMPGLIDAHVHVNALDANLKVNSALPDPIMTIGAMNLMHRMLLRGFTTVRDLGGATGAFRTVMSAAPIALP